MSHKDVRLTNRTEMELINLAKNGDGRAFEELIRPNYAKWQRLAASILHDSVEAEDVTQSGCLKAFRQLHQFRGESSFATWLGHIVVNHARSVLRYRQRHGLASIDEKLIVHRNGPGTLPDFSMDPEHSLGTRQIQIILSREIKLIPAIFRKVLVLRHLEELPLREIASEMNLPVQTVKTRLFRGRNELRSRMLKHCGPRRHVQFMN